MFDLDGNGQVDVGEFQKVQQVILDTTAVGARHRDHKTTGNVAGEGVVCVCTVLCVWLVSVCVCVCVCTVPCVWVVRVFVCTEFQPNTMDYSPWSKKSGKLWPQPNFGFKHIILKVSF